MDAPLTPGVPAERTSRAAVLLAPIWAGLAAALSAAVPVAAPFLLPVSTARLARTLFLVRTPVRALALAAATLPVAFLVGTVLAPAGGFLSLIAADAFVALPALAVLAGARDGRRGDELALLVSAVTAIGGLSILLGAAVATGRDPGWALSEAWTAQGPHLIETYRSMGWPESSLGALREAIDLVKEVLAEHIPGVILAVSVLYGVVVVYPFGRLAGLPSRPLEAPSFAAFRTPLAAAAVFVPAGVAAAIGSGVPRRVAVDLLMVLAVLFFLRGLAIIRALLDRGRVGLLGRALAYALAIQMPFSAILALGGLFDEFLDLRGRLDRASAGQGGDGGAGSSR